MATLHLGVALQKLCGPQSKALLGSAVPKPSLKKLPAAPHTLGPDLQTPSPSESPLRASSLKLWQCCLHPHAPPARGSFSQPLLVFANSCPDLCFGTYLGCNYMFTDLFPIMSSSEPQHALNKTRQQLSD